MSEPKTEWKSVEFLITPTKQTRWANDDDWEWKKPFQELKKSTIRIEDPLHIVLTVGEGELDTINQMCDGRFKVETLMQREPMKKKEEKKEEILKVKEPVQKEETED